MDKGYSCYNSIIGTLKISYDNGYIVGVEIISEPLQSVTKNNQLTDEIYTQIKEYLAGERHEFSVRIRYDGSSFQRAVLDELLRIPYGTTTSYKEIARRIGHIRAFRAVGSAIHKNPLCIIVPCHRVIGADNSLVGYAYGIEIKKRLLAIEGVKFD